MLMTTADPLHPKKNDKRAVFHGDFDRAIIPSVIELGSAIDRCDATEFTAS
jgi:hypothetical protein